MIPVFIQAVRTAPCVNVLSAIGSAAPAAGAPLHATLQRQLGAWMEAARADHKQFLSPATREALLSGLSAHRARDPEDLIDSVVRDGYVSRCHIRAQTAQRFPIGISSVEAPR